MLLRIDVHFSKCFLAIEINEKGHTDRDIIFEEKRQNGYHLDYEVSNVQAFIDEFKNKNIKKKKKKLIKEKELEEKLEKQMREKSEKELKEKLEDEVKDKNKELKKKIKKLTSNQIIDHFGKILMKN